MLEGLDFLCKIVTLQKASTILQKHKNTIGKNAYTESVFFRKILVKLVPPDVGSNLRLKCTNCDLCWGLLYLWGLLIRGRTGKGDGRGKMMERGGTEWERRGGGKEARTGTEERACKSVQLRAPLGS